MLKSQAIVLISIISLSISCLDTKAQVKGNIYIDVGKATIKKSLIALPSFQYFASTKANKKHLKIGQEIFNTVFNDLLVSDYFTFISQNAFLEDTKKTSLKPAPADSKGFNFKNWRLIGAEFLIRAGYKIIGNKLTFEAYVYYVPQAKLVLGKTYEGLATIPRKIAHKFCNDTIKALTGKRGMFNSKIVVAATQKNKSFKEIYVMDWDGFNLKKITNHKSIAISPAWSPDGKQIAYTAFAYHPKAKTRNADLFLYSLVSGKRWLLSYRKGINSGAAFMPNGKSILLSISQKNNPDIFEIDLNGKKLRRITRSPNRSMSVEPAPSPNGQQIAFSSDRSGQPMIYIKNIKGGKLYRMTYAGRYNANPGWSPDGKTLAFAGFDKGHFDIFLLNLATKQLTRLTSSKKSNGKWADNEDPTFSPDGRHIMFVSNRTGRNQLYIVNPDGSNERRITVDSKSYFKPKWSNYLDE